VDLYSLSISLLELLCGLGLINRIYRMLIKCYRLDYRSDYDEELVWSLVQRHGGYISIRQTCIDFWLHESWEVVLNLAFPDLVRQADLDYIE
jgi:hypothetical protein